MDILRKFFETEKNKQSILILFFIGVLLVVVNNFGKQNNFNEPKSFETEEIIQYTDYSKSLENKLENILSEVAGAGDVSVMITLNNEGEKTLAFDYDYSSKKTNETDNNGGIREIEELTENTNTLFSNSVPVILKESTPSVKGVVIITEGGDNVEIVQSFRNVCMALLDLPAHKIQVLKKK